MLAIKKFYQKSKKGMDKKNLRISALSVLNNELPDVKVFFEDKGTLYGKACLCSRTTNH